MIDRLDGHLRNIAAQYAPGARYLAIVRVAVAVRVVAVPLDLRWIAGIPADFYNPPTGPFALLPGPASKPVLLGLMGANAVLAVLVGVGMGTLPASVGLSASLTASHGVAYSFSQVDHFILVAIAPVFLALAGWGRSWSVDAWLRHRRGSPPAPVRALPVLLLGMTIGWGMLSAAIPKARGGWLDPARHAARGYVARDVALGERIGPLGQTILTIDSSAFWKGLDYATLLLEGGLLLALLLPLLFRLLLVIAAGFHAGVYLVLGIDFSAYLLVYAAFFAPAVAWLAMRIRGTQPVRRSTSLDLAP